MKMKNWQIRALNFEVRAIETLLGIKFEGTTLKEKQSFAEKHKSDRIALTAELLRQSHENYMKDQAHYSEKEGE